MAQATPMPMCPMAESWKGMMEMPLSGAVRTDGAALTAYLQGLPSAKSQALDPPYLTVVMPE